MSVSISTYETAVNKTCGIETSSNSSKNAKNTFSPFVRYADTEAKQKPELRHIDDKIPNDACFASPIYYLGDRQISEQFDLSNPYAVSDSNIANKLQKEAEEQQTVYYPVYIESDAEVGFSQQIDWLKEFCREYLNVEPYQCTWYYSGNRSIHAHVPVLATENQIDSLREYGKQYEYDIDAQVYSRKRQFRLPGVTHEKTGLQKVEIEPDWENDTIFREANESDVSKPETFREVLSKTFGSDVIEQPQTYLWEPQEQSEVINPGLNDWETHEWSMPEPTLKKWKAHYSTPVSPYAKAGNGNRSLLIAKMVDGEFGEKREKFGEYEGEQPHTFVPTEVIKFWGCDRGYTTQADYRPVKLSKRDYQKFVACDIEPGDMFAAIGGKSRKSRVFKLSAFEAKTIAGGKDFSDAIRGFEYFDYETGEAGLDGERKTGYSPQSNHSNEEHTRAYKLQEKAEKEGIGTLSHIEIRIVANRLLQQYGLGDTRDWFREQYGEDFDTDIAETQIRDLCNTFNDLPKYERSDSNVTRTSI